MVLFAALPRVPVNRQRVCEEMLAEWTLGERIASRCDFNSRALPIGYVLPMGNKLKTMS